MTIRRAIFTLLTLLAVACLAATAVAGLTGAFWFTSANQPTAAPTATFEPLPVIARGDIPAEISTQMDQIQFEVSSLRRLNAARPLDRALLTPDELKDKVLDDFFKEYPREEASNDSLVLNTLGLIPSSFGLYDLYIDMYSEQIAGYFDPESKAMFVVKGKEFSGAERMTYAHEFTHVLQDQNFDLREGLGFKDENCEKDSERCSAVQALIEGDATLTEQLWFIRHASQADRSELAAMVDAYQSPVFDSAPSYLQKDFLFPYQAGAEFVQSLYDQNGWSSVDQAFRDPPVSTEQILHPDKYPAEKPFPVAFTNLDGKLNGCRQIDDGALGEWYTTLVLAEGYNQAWRQPLATARAAAAGWGGDHYQVFDCSGKAVLALRTHWDTLQDANEFWNAFQGYGIARWGAGKAAGTDRLVWKDTSEGYVTLVRSGADTLWILARDMVEAGTILQNTPGFQEP